MNGRTIDISKFAYLYFWYMKNYFLENYKKT